MPVFKMYMKIVLSKKKVILLYMIIFFAVFYSLTQYYSKSDKLATDFDKKAVSIAIYDKDDSELSRNFAEYLESKATIVEIEDSEEAIKDALFFTTISYAITIPENFEEAFFTDNPLRIDSVSRPDSASGMIIEQPINSYLSSIKSYHNVNPSLSIEEITSGVIRAFDQKTTIEISKDNEVDSISQGRGMFFNFMSYMFVSLSILIGGGVFLRVYDTEIRKRNMVSPISNLSFNLQLVLASICVSFAIWLVFMLDIQISMGGLFTTKGFFYMLNSILLVFTSVGFTFVIVNILAGKKNQDDALNGISNLYGLGSSFLCGVFIPQLMLGDSVRAVASFLPNFWYVKANDLLVSAKHFDFNSMREVYKCFGIELLFAVAFFVIAMYISKTKANMKEL